MPNPEGCIAAERAKMGAENRTDEEARGASNYTPKLLLQRMRRPRPGWFREPSAAHR